MRKYQLPDQDLNTEVQGEKGGVRTSVSSSLSPNTVKVTVGFYCVHFRDGKTEALK